MATSEIHSVEARYEQEKASALRARAARRAPAEDGHQSVASPDTALSSLPSAGSAGGQESPDDLEQPADESQAAEAVEADVPLDAWWGSFGDPATRAALRAGAVGSVAEVVIGADDRTEITATNQYPWSAVASLRITAADGTGFIGTGWFVSPRLVLTAGHCVYMQDRGGWVRQIEVIPGRHANDQPFGSVVATAMRSTQGWVNSSDTNFDYGAILLPENSRLGDTVGWFGYESRGDDGLQDRIVNIVGYPGDKPAGTLWIHSNTITAVHDLTLDYQIDTFGGQSGAPVYMYFEDRGRIGVGIHTHGSVAGNSATRLTSQVLTNINAWKAEVP